MQKEPIERRRHPRFQFPISTFVGLGPYFGKVGRLTDLSLGGLSFRYIGSEERDGSFYLDVFMNDLDFYLRNMPFITVSDFAVVSEAPTSITLRRRGVQFGEMTSGQRAELERFIQKHAIGKA